MNYPEAPILNAKSTGVMSMAQGLVAAATVLGKREFQLDGTPTSAAHLTGMAASLGLCPRIQKLPLAELGKPPVSCRETTALAFLESGVALLSRNHAGLRWQGAFPADEYLGYLMLLSLPENSAEPSVLATGKSGLGWLFLALTSQKEDFLWMLVASGGIQLAALTTPFMTMAVYDRVVPNGAMETLTAIAVGALLMYGFDFLLRILRSWFGDVASKSVDRALSSQLIDQALRMEMTGRPASAGAFAARLRQYEGVREFFTAATVTAAVDLPMGLLLTLAIFWLGGATGWIPLAFAALILLQTLLFQPWLRKAIHRSHELSIDRQAALGEMINGLEAVKAANAETPLASQLQALEEQSAMADMSVKRLTSFGSNLTLLCVNLATIGVMVACVVMIGEKAMSMGGMIACMMISGRAMSPLVSTAGLLLRLQQMLVSLRSLRQLMGLPREDDRPTLRHTLQYPPLRCESVSFSYPNQATLALKEISFLIRPGESVGILGRAGCGKTTLLRLLCRLHVPTSGLALMDGVDMGQLAPANIRSVCGYLPQDPVIFHGSARENILLGRQGITDEDMVAAARQCGALEWINRHPQGFNLPVGERGTLLSGGQRQSLAAARVMAGHPQILLLDEPASNFDIVTERHFREALETWRAEEPRRSLVLATHKMSLLSLVDRILVMDAGRIIADGLRDEVLAKLSAKPL